MKKISKKDNTIKYLVTVIFVLLGVLYIVRFAGISLLRFYVESGLGSCKQIPILCMNPQEKISNPEINEECMVNLVPQSLPVIEICIPKGFSLVYERTKKIYHKKSKNYFNEDIIYILYEEPGFFVSLFPRLKKYGITDNYDFLNKTMHARLNDINSINDAFFVIMKSVFIPDVGNQMTVNMASFKLADKKGFINYNIGKEGNYFDCNIIDNKGGFFKVYVKDKKARLTLDKIFAILATVNKKD